MSVPVYASYNGRSFRLGSHNETHPLGPVGHVIISIDPETGYSRRVYQPINFGGAYRHPQPPQTITRHWES